MVVIKEGKVDIIISFFIAMKNQSKKIQTLNDYDIVGLEHFIDQTLNQKYDAIA